MSYQNEYKYIPPYVSKEELVAIRDSARHNPMLEGFDRIISSLEQAHRAEQVTANLYKVYHIDSQREADKVRKDKS